MIFIDIDTYQYLAFTSCYKMSTLMHSFFNGITLRVSKKYIDDGRLYAGIGDEGTMQSLLPNY